MPRILLYEVLSVRKRRRHSRLRHFLYDGTDSWNSYPQYSNSLLYLIYKGKAQAWRDRFLTLFVSQSRVWYDSKYEIYVSVPYLVPPTRVFLRSRPRKRDATSSPGSSAREAPDVHDCIYLYLRNSSNGRKDAVCIITERLWLLVSLNYIYLIEL